MNGDSPTSSTRPDRLSTWLSVGPIVLFLAAAAYGILEVHAANDTWIGLAAGRQILTADEFPTTDTFSYTFYGRAWYNQNWLTHLCHYWLYSRVSPDAVVYANWTLCVSIFVLALLGAYWRSGTWTGALLMGAVVALACRDFLNPRAATAGFFCLASLWALLCALEGQRSKRRRWPIFLLLPLLLVWGSAHGSFVFGYGVLGLYVGHWFVVRTVRVRLAWLFSLALVLLLLLTGGILYSIVPPGVNPRPEEVWKLGTTVYYKQKLALLGAVLVAYGAYWICVHTYRPRLAISGRQLAGIVGVIAAALVLTAVFGPFGIHNFAHGDKVASSSMFRQVSEWHPAYVPGRSFPPVWRFWTILGVALGSLAACGLLRRFAPKGDEPGPASTRLHTSLFDVALVIIGLSMALWARRFAPICFIFGAPVFLTWVVLLLRPLTGLLRRHLRHAVMAGAGLFALAVAMATVTKARAELIKAYEDYPRFNLLERVTRYNTNSHNAIQFLKENKLDVNLLVEWAQAGLVMLHAPSAKVFMDGRAQQVYDEAHYRRYCLLLVARDTPGPLMMRVLDQHNTDAVLLRRTSKAENLWAALEQSPRWVPVLLSMRDGLFLRRGSRGLAQLGELLRRGQEWRPNAPRALAARGLVWRAITPPDLEQAIACWQAALRQDLTTGTICLRPVVEALLELGRIHEARQFVEECEQRLNQPGSRLPKRLRRELAETLATCRQDIEAASVLQPPPAVGQEGTPPKPSRGRLDHTNDPG